MTVVINGAEIENLAPKRPKTLTVQSCKVCKDLRTDRPVSDPPPQGRPTALSLSGKWSSVQKCSYGTGTSNMEIQYDESSGTISGKLANATIDSGSIKGTKITATASNWLGNRVQLEGEVVGPSEIRGTYSQSAMAGTCTWEARKLP